MARLDRNRRIEGGERLLRPRKLQQHIAAVVECLEIVGCERERLVDAGERLRIAIERGQRERAIGQCLRHRRIDLERGLDERERGARLAGLQLDEA